jgi:hypothetical protein
MWNRNWERRDFLKSLVAAGTIQAATPGSIDRWLEQDILAVVTDTSRTTAPEITEKLWGPFESRRAEIRYNTWLRGKLREMERRGSLERKPISDYPPPMRLAPVWRTT